MCVSLAARGSGRQGPGGAFLPARAKKKAEKVALNQPAWLCQSSFAAFGGRPRAWPGMEPAGFGEKAPCFVHLVALVQRAQCRSANRAGLAVLVFSSLPLWGKAVLSLPLAGDFPAPGAPWSSPRLCLLCAAGNFCPELPPGTALLPARCCSPRVLHHPAPILLCSSVRPTDSSGRAPPGLSPSFHFCTTAYNRSDAPIAKQRMGQESQETQYSWAARGS